MGRLQLHFPRCSLSKSRQYWVGAVSGVSVLLIIFMTLLRRSEFEEVQFSNFIVEASAPQQEKSSSETDGLQKLRYFKHVDQQETFLYSAISNPREPTEGEVNIIITAFDSTGSDSFTCCVVVEGGKLYTTTASLFHSYYTESHLGPFLELFKNAPTKAKQYACVVPRLGIEVGRVTLTATSACPSSAESYLPVVRPEVVPQGLALCAKVAFGDGLDPNKLMEWLEVQRLLGVDHIQLMDLNNPEPIQKVFAYYQKLGLLNAMPYELPGKPFNRGLDGKHWVPQQASHDETFPILDCKQRLRGYTYVLGHDMDEVLVPVDRDSSLKDLVKQQLLKHPDAAGFYFYTQFFIYNWGPENRQSDISLFQYLNSTEPRNECKKYIYLSTRVSQARTHEFYPRGAYKEYFVPTSDAVLHHYRMCPAHVWSTCHPRQITDRSMLRFQGVLEERLEKARQATGIRPKSKTNTKENKNS